MLAHCLHCAYINGHALHVAALNRERVMSQIRETDPAGAPFGSYDVSYYIVGRDGDVKRRPSDDSNVSLRYVEGLKLGEHEVAYAACRSQPGGVTMYGSQWARDAFEASRFG
jgi:hypothetical protein